MQYHDELPCDPATIEIYAGQNDSFCLYEDEGDSYRYEQGAYSEIAFYWDDKVACLSIAKRRGQFMGMLSLRSFNLVLFTGSNASVDKTGEYCGDAVLIEFL